MKDGPKSQSFIVSSSFRLCASVSVIYVTALKALTWEACVQPLGNRNKSKSEKDCGKWWQ